MHACPFARAFAQEMALTGKGLDRHTFKLITRGHGPIGAPTRTLDEQYGAPP